MNTTRKHHCLSLTVILTLFWTLSLSPLAVANDADSADAQASGVLKAIGTRGGLIVHLGCGNGGLTAALCVSGNCLVHGLDTDAAVVERAREHIRSLGQYGRVSIDRFDGHQLPYIDNVVNVVVASGRGPAAAGKWQVTSEEIARVLAPGGVAFVEKGSLDTGHSPLLTQSSTGFARWSTFVKRAPSELDEWTHYLYDASNNAVSKDAVVDPPASLQWVSGPKFSRSHEHLASLSAAVATGGRIFSLEDSGPIQSVAFPASWFLVARDAYNGITLWKRKMGSWEWHLREFRHGPPQLPRRLVGVGDRVYVTLSYGGPVEAIDTATGETVTTYKGTEGAEEIIFTEGKLLLAVGDAKPAVKADARRSGPAGTTRRVLAIDADSGNVAWENIVEKLAPVTLGAVDGRAFYQDGACAVTVDLKTGAELWRSEPLAVQASKAAWYSPVLVSYEDVMLWADGKMLTGLDAKTGKTLWKSQSEVNWHAPPDVLVAGGLVWTGKLRIHTQPGITQGLDPKTGEIKMTRPPDQETFACGMTHHRCYRNKGTNRWLMLGRAGTEYLDVATGEIYPHHWARGMCQYGVMPANGLLYVPPHACACFLTAKLNGFNAFAAERQRPEVRDQRSGRLEKGPAYPEVRNQKSEVRRQTPSRAAGDPTSDLRPLTSGNDWPTYRHDALRSGRASTVVATEVKQHWRADVGGKLSAVTVAVGKCFVAAADDHAIHALNAETGDCVWTFTAGGRVDSPPTIAAGLAVFGCRDGYVYCLRASDGELVWRFRASPADRRIVAYGQLESLWPVRGSVLVEGDEVMFAAGRSSFIDGGIRLFRLELKTGRLLTESRVYTPDPKTHRQPREAVSGFNLGGALPDVLASDGETIFMRQLCFTPDDLKPAPAKRHLFSPTGLLDDSWWHRTYWLYGDSFTSGWPGWWQTGNKVPAGRILAIDEDTVYGFGRSQFRNWSRNAGANWAAQEPYHLFAAAKDAKPAPPPAAKPAKKKPRAKRGPAKMTFKWSTDPPIRARALVLAGKTLFFAGTPNQGNSSDEARAAMIGKEGAKLVAVSTEDGAKLAELPLSAPPVLDGMTAAGGHLYLSTVDGQIVCFGE